MLSACAGTGDGNKTGAASDSGNKPSQTAAAATATSGESSEPAEKMPEDYKGTITLWGWDANYYDTSFKEFQKTYPNVKLEVTNVTAGDYVQKIQTTIASGGVLPDLLVGESGFRAKAFEIDIWENLEKAPYNFDKSSVFDYLLPLTSNSKGEIVGIEQTLTPAAMAYRRDLAKKYLGTDDPKQLEALFPTWEELIKKGKELKEKDGIYMFASLGDVYTFLSGQTETPFYDGATVNVTGRMKDILEKVVEVRDSGIVDKLEMWTPAWNASYAGGKHLFYPAANWSTQYVIKTNDKDGEGRWGLMLPPGGPFTWGGTTFGISKESKNKELAWLFIKWLLLTKEGASISKDLGFYVPLKSVYEDPNFASSPDPFFAGQDIGAFWINDVVPNIGTLKISQYDSVINDAANLSIILLNSDRKVMAADALDKLLKEVKAKLPDVEVK